MAQSKGLAGGSWQSMCTVHQGTCQQATLPWTGYLDTGLGQQTESLHKVMEKLVTTSLPHG